jgi:hypothetical protein
MELAKWSQMTLIQQLGNIGSEFSRTVSWKQKPNFGDFRKPFYRGLEYLDLSINDPKNSGARRKELCRVREALVDWHYGSRLYHTTDSDWSSYFNCFAIAANRK